MDMREAIIAEVKTMNSYKRAVALMPGREDDALRACAEGLMTGKLVFILDNIAAAQRMLRDGNVSGAGMLLDMCKDPRKETA